MAVVCINDYFFNADFAFLFISGTFYTNPTDTTDTHLQIVLIIADAPECCWSKNSPNLQWQDSRLIYDN